MPSRRLALAAVVLLVALPAAAGPASAAGAAQPSKHAQTLAYWTPERIRAAKARDFVLAGGKLVPAAKPVKPGGGSTTGAQWPDGKGKVYRATGRVLFTLDSGDYICSGAPATESNTGRSIVLTAAHCAYDGADGGFARNWMFFPEFDTTPTYSCADAALGCWSATALVVHSGFANEDGFTSNAILHDWAFAVVENGGRSGTQLDATVGSFPIAFRSYTANTQTYAFGYPAGGKYSPGYELIYSAGPLGFDPYTSNKTYRLTSNLTGGSSGGPWLTGFDATTGDTGTLSSVNSYTRSGVRAIHGPIFNSKTQATFNTALTTSANAIVP